MLMYIELHARSAFSFLQGAVLPDALAYGCVQLDLPGMALVDRNGVSGAPFFHQSMTNNKLKAHVGAEKPTNACFSDTARNAELLCPNPETRSVRVCRGLDSFNLSDFR